MKKYILSLFTIIFFSYPCFAIEYKVTGFIRPTYSFSSASVSSFGSASGSSWQRDNQVAATEASPRTGVNFSKVHRSHWTVGQSRIGLTTKKESTEGILEFDFIDFDRSEATVAIRPRLRVAGIKHDINSHFSVFAGQDWDILSVIKPHTYNFVSLYFRAGNIGFMRTQARISYFDDNQKERFTFSLGAAGLNDSDSNSSAVERGTTPVFSSRIFVLNNETLITGLAANYTSRRMESGLVSRQQNTWTAKFFIELKPSSVFDLRASFFTGKNTQSTSSMLSLASASYSGSQSEIGGYLTSSIKITHNFETLFGCGFDKILTSSENRAGQLRQNWVSRIGMGLNITDSLKFFEENTYFNSLYSWDSGLDRQRSKSFQFETGLIYTL